MIKARQSHWGNNILLRSPDLLLYRKVCLSGNAAANFNTDKVLKSPFRLVHTYAVCLPFVQV